MKKIIFYLLPILLTACSGETKKEDPIPTTETPVKRDTINIGKHVYFIEESKPITMPPIAELLSDTTDEPAIKPFGQFVSRNGDSLFFKCDNGKSVKLVNNRNEEEMAMFSFLTLDTSISYYVVMRSLYEGRDYILINKKSGEPLETIGIPVVSPKRNFFVCGNCDLEAGFDINGLEVFQLKNTSYKSIGRRELTDWGPTKLLWKNDTSLVVEALKASVNEQFYKVIFIK